MNHAKGFLAIVEQTKLRVKEVTPQEVMDKINSNHEFLLIDVREDSEWNSGHIKGATHIGKGVIERDIEANVANKDAELVLYCGGGFRSVLACGALQEMGYTNVYSMSEGWRGWKDNDFPTEV